MESAADSGANVARSIRARGAGQFGFMQFSLIECGVIKSCFQNIENQEIVNLCDFFSGATDRNCSQKWGSQHPLPTFRGHLELLLTDQTIRMMQMTGLLKLSATSPDVYCLIPSWIFPVKL
jgi:hypothetical protein